MAGNAKGKVLLGLVGVTSLSYGAILGKGKGFYGKIELGYTYENWRYQNGLDIDVKRNVFSQNYQLGFNGFIYHPRLLSFDVKTDFRLSRSTYDSGTSTTDNRFRGLGYVLNMRFLSGTRFPFNVSLGRRYTLSRLLGGYREQEVDTQMDFLSFNLSYLFRKNWHFTTYFRYTNVDSTVDFIDYTDKSTNFGFTTSYSRDDRRISFSFSQTDMSNNSPFYAYSDTIRRLNFSARFIRETWNLGLRSSYYSSSLANLNVFTQSVSYGYRPSKKLDLSVASFLTLSRGNTDTNYYSITQRLNYRPGKHWNFFQSANFYSLENVRSVSLAGGAGYGRSLSETFSFGFSASSSVNQYFGDQSDTYYGFNLSGHLSKLFKKWHARFYAGANFNQLFINGSTATTNARLNENFTATLTRSLTFSHTASYTQSTSQEYDYDYQLFRSSNTLTHKVRLFRNLFLRTQVGLDYWKMFSTDAESFKPFARTFGTWPVTRRLHLNFEAEVYRDSYYDNTLTLRTSAKATYRIRKTVITFNFRYTQEEFTGDAGYSRYRLITGIKLTRYF
ncbi:MAG: hypothetical protein GXO03_02545 [Aquificae bacterium]|nr:hypothetical protein [Aquificota bacterium]